MNAQIGLMIEGQDGLNWERWGRLLRTVEDAGYQCLFRSDHFTNAGGPLKDSLDLWLALTYAATHTERIEFGPLVSPVTFRHPSIAARMAVQVDDLSNGRFIYGVGAGWQEREHEMFGIPFYDFPTRYAMLEDTLEVTKRLFENDEPVSYEGEHFSLHEALLLPRPPRKTPLLVGGNGPKRTLPLVARFADEWNAVFAPLDLYKERTERLNNLLDEQGRAPGDVKRSLMTQVIFARDDADLQRMLEQRSQQQDETVTVESVRQHGPVIGTASMLVDQLGEYVEAGVERFMLQWLPQDDTEGIELLARDVLPHFHQ